MAKKLTFDEIAKGIEKGIYKFSGFITQKEVRLLKKGYVYAETNRSYDIISDLLGSEKRNIYVYKKIKH